MFVSYYDGLKDSSKRRNFTTSEFLIMTSALMMGLDAMMDKARHKKTLSYTICRIS